MAHTEFIPDGTAIFRGEKMKTYQCPRCLKWIFTQYEGNAPLLPNGVQCHGFMSGHTLTWEDEPAGALKPLEDT